MNRTARIAAVAVCLLATALSFTITISSLLDRPPKRDAHTFVGDDFPEFWEIKTLPYVAMTVEESVHYSVSGIGAREEWASYSPDGYGYLRLGAEYRAFALSFLHEDHCLRLIRTMLDGTASNLTLTQTIPYCLNYIRQVILCDPNLTLEPADVLERNYDVQRSGATHVCSDWRVIHTELAKNWKDWYKYKKSHEL